jgi:hypothetical protein
VCVEQLMRVSDTRQEMKKQMPSLMQPSLWEESEDYYS